MARPICSKDSNHKALFALLSLLGLSYQVYLLVDEYISSTVPVITLERRELKELPAITLCIDWPNYIDKQLFLTDLSGYVANGTEPDDLSQLANYELIERLPNHELFNICVDALRKEWAEKELGLEAFEDAYFEHCRPLQWENFWLEMFKSGFVNRYSLKEPHRRLRHGLTGPVSQLITIYGQGRLVLRDVETGRDEELSGTTALLNVQNEAWYHADEKTPSREVRKCFSYLIQMLPRDYHTQTKDSGRTNSGSRPKSWEEIHPKSTFFRAAQLNDLVIRFNLEAIRERGLFSRNATLDEVSRYVSVIFHNPYSLSQDARKSGYHPSPQTWHQVIVKRTTIQSITGLNRDTCVNYDMKNDSSQIHAPTKHRFMSREHCIWYHYAMACFGKFDSICHMPVLENWLLGKWWVSIGDLPPRADRQDLNEGERQAIEVLCKPSCTEYLYEFLFKYPPSSFTKDDNIPSTSTVEMVISTDPEIMVEYRAKISEGELLAQLGGILGIWFGVSIFGLYGYYAALWQCIKNIFHPQTHVSSMINPLS